MDGLFGFDPEQLKQLMSQFGATEQDKTDANKQAAFALGFGLLQGRKGNELATIGQAGLGAMGARQASLASSGQQRQQGLQNALGMAKLAQAAQAQQSAAAQAQEMGTAFSSAPQLGNMTPGGPTPANAAAVAPPSIVEQYRKASVIAAKNGNSEAAKRYADIANSMEAEYSTTPQTLKDAQGNIVSTLIGKRGEVKKLDYTPAEKLNFISTGGAAGVGLNPYTGKAESAGLPTTMSPEQIDASKRGWAGLAQSERHFQQGQDAGQVVQGEGGFYRVPKQGPAVPIPAAGGGQLQTPMPATIKEKVAQNNVTLGKIDTGLAALEAYPAAFGVSNMMGDAIRQRTDPKGVAARAAISDIAGQKIHDRSGGNVTIGEAKRLEPYVPNVTDSPATVKIKLVGLRREYAAMQQELMGGKSINEVAGAARGGSGGKIVRFEDLK